VRVSYPEEMKGLTVMTLLPADVEQKTFSTALRGYDLDEVDDFLDEVVATIKDLSEQLAAAERAPAPAPVDGRADARAPDETAVGRALVAAQQTADEIVAEARREAERIVREADTEAENLESEKERRKVEAEAEMAELSERVAAVRAQLAVLATAVADRLDEMDQTLGMSHEENDEDTGNKEHTGDHTGDATDSTDEQTGDESAGEGWSNRRFETGKHTGVGEQVDISEEVESFVLEEDPMESTSEESEVADTSEKTW
jgi:cell division initiation protein